VAPERKFTLIFFNKIAWNCCLKLAPIQQFIEWL
jgi:hypothetical protein